MRIGLGMGLWRGQIIVRRWDADALAYITQVEAADGQPLEAKVKLAINRLVIRCKRDASPVSGISNWDAIQNCGLLAGPRTLAGALIALKGENPVNYSFVSGDYNAIAGLKGNGSNKGLGFPSTSDSPVYMQIYHHMAFFCATPYSELTAGRFGMSFAKSGSRTSFICVKSSEATPSDAVDFRIGSGYGTVPDGHTVPDSDFIGFYGATRASSFAVNELQSLIGGGSVKSQISVPSNNATKEQTLAIFRYSGAVSWFNGRISFYSAGYPVDLVSLRDAVNAYMEAIA